ncbi:hypothetical protein PR003_g22333 [Phytophthora rubi]|uniref:Uncharacterized protein n=1 Tax=Phytophthora rubi TaxID=129364 RepID=A0A6A3JJ45_9STRA|nr:hypothetical protein PR002_g21644 [Phytophthora rubi]KAE8992064.1 hypothetical protein PR001_g21050 [Phytophthora rubi]KAE9302207.1 hypothetical protein PR003_g22333 [Phytophthora rubi]
MTGNGATSVKLVLDALRVAHKVGSLVLVSLQQQSLHSQPQRQRQQLDNAPIHSQQLESPSQQPQSQQSQSQPLQSNLHLQSHITSEGDRYRLVLRSRTNEKWLLLAAQLSARWVNSMVVTFSSSMPR